MSDLMMKDQFHIVVVPDTFGYAVHVIDFSSYMVVDVIGGPQELTVAIADIYNETGPASEHYVVEYAPRGTVVKVPQALLDYMSDDDQHRMENDYI